MATRKKVTKTIVTLEYFDPKRSSSSSSSSKKRKRSSSKSQSNPVVLGQKAPVTHHALFPRLLMALNSLTVVNDAQLPKIVVIPMVSISRGVARSTNTDMPFVKSTVTAENIHEFAAMNLSGANSLNAIVCVPEPTYFQCKCCNGGDDSLFCKSPTPLVVLTRGYKDPEASKFPCDGQENTARKIVLQLIIDVLSLHNLSVSLDKTYLVDETFEEYLSAQAGGIGNVMEHNLLVHFKKEKEKEKEAEDTELELELEAPKTKKAKSIKS
jgi:hypothetical protein